MSRLVIATNNQGKLKEIKAILGGFFDEVKSLKEAGIILEVIEDGETFEQNAMKKALQADEITGCDTLADDSGLCVDALGGAPGVYSARYSGENATDGENNNKLLWEMRGIKNRNAKFVCVMALVYGGEVITARGEVPGVITYAPSGEGSFGYDPLFFSEEFGQTFGELPEGIKNSISHRARALAALKETLLERRGV
jgi:XTP/dITP diphosphohydrolase